jgi:hypothetical protein
VLSDAEVERRVDVRGGGTPPPPPIERPIRRPPPGRRPDRNIARDSLLLIGLVIVGLVAVSFLLPDGPLTSKATLPPSSEVAIASATPTAPATSSPTSTSGVVVVPSLDASPLASAVPTAVPTAAPPTPTLAPGATPRPTAKPTPTPKVTPRPTPGPTPPPGSPTLTVIVNVTNNDGGTAVPSNWLIDFGGGSASPSSFNGSSAGTLVSVAAGKPYQIFDTARITEAVGYAANCASSTGGLLVAGQHYTCTITQNDKPAQVKVVTVVNGPDAPSAWDVSVTGTNVSPAGSVAGSSSGVTFSFDAHASFDVQQSGQAGYDTPDTSGTCTSGGLLPGAHVTCTFTFNETPPPPTPTPDPSLALLFPASFLLLLRRRWRPILRT